MKKGAHHILRLALLALMFQLVCPLFITVVTRADDFTVRNSKTVLHSETHSVKVPILLKEKDETESDQDHSVVEFIALIDFSKLPAVLSEFHNTKIIPIISLSRYDYRPPLFALNSVFLI